MLNDGVNIIETGARYYFLFGELYIKGWKQNIIWTFQQRLLLEKD